MNKNNKYLHFYTDGSCNNKSIEKIGAWSFAGFINGKDEPFIIQVGYEFNSSSQKSEMDAVINLLLYIKTKYKKRNINIYTDSAYISNCLNNKWYEKWIDEEFLFIKNVDKWKMLLNLYFDCSLKNRIKIIKIKGHSGIIGNELVDKLCTDKRKEIENLKLFNKMMRFKNSKKD